MYAIKISDDIITCLIFISSLSVSSFLWRTVSSEGRWCGTFSCRQTSATHSYYRMPLGKRQHRAKLDYKQNQLNRHCVMEKNFGLSMLRSNGPRRIKMFQGLLRWCLEMEHNFILTSAWEWSQRSYLWKRMLFLIFILFSVFRSYWSDMSSLVSLDVHVRSWFQMTATQYSHFVIVKMRMMHSWSIVNNFVNVLG